MLLVIKKFEQIFFGIFFNYLILSTYEMHLMYTLSPDGKRIYTLKKITADGKRTMSAHPARFSPDDKFSRSVKHTTPPAVHI